MVCGGKVIIIPRDLELRLAVNALPSPLREGATIRVMEPDGYTEARRGTNAFTCIVSRRGGNFYPVCFDQEGAHTILPAYEDDAIMRLKGMSDVEVESALAKGFADGKYRPPARAGIAYMLSPATYMFEHGKLNRTPPHTMFYAPFLTDADVGWRSGPDTIHRSPRPARSVHRAYRQSGARKIDRRFAITRQRSRKGHRPAVVLTHRRLTMNMKQFLVKFLPVTAILCTGVAATQAPYSPPAVPTTKILAMGHLTKGTDRSMIAPVMKEEVPATMKLYLDGTLDQFFFPQ